MNFQVSSVSASRPPCGMTTDAVHRVHNHTTNTVVIALSYPQPTNHITIKALHKFSARICMHACSIKTVCIGCNNGRGYANHFPISTGTFITLLPADHSLVYRFIHWYNVTVQKALYPVFSVLPDVFVDVVQHVIETTTYFP